MVAFQQLHRVLQSHLVVYLVAHHQITVYRNFVVAQGLQIPVLAAAHHINMVGASDECNALAARLYQVLRSLIGCLVTVRRDARETVRQTRASEEHQGHAHLGNLLEVLIVLRVLRQTGYNTLHVQSQEVVHRHRLVLVALVTVGTDHAIPRAPRLSLYTVQHRSIIVRHQVRHHDANHLRSLLAQTLCKGVRTVVQFLGQVLHALLHVLTNFRRTAQGTADGCYADTQFACQVFQRCSVLLVVCHNRTVFSYWLQSYVKLRKSANVYVCFFCFFA